jgi:flagellar M-ring protein FliF
LTPWLGQDRVSVQVTAMLEDSETRQTVEQVRNVVMAGQAHPLEKTVRTTRVPEGRIQRLNAIVILGFDASADELQRAEQLARQALGLMAARGDSMNVYALPAGPGRSRVPAEIRAALIPTPQRQPVSPPPARPSFDFPRGTCGRCGDPGVLGTPGGCAPVDPSPKRWWGFRREPGPPAARRADPRVTADVIKLWMRTGQAESKNPPRCCWPWARRPRPPSSVT